MNETPEREIYIYSGHIGLSNMPMPPLNFLNDPKSNVLIV